MAYSCEDRKRLLAADLPKSNQVRKLLLDYLNRSGLSQGDFARRINYSSQTVRAFICGAYQSIAGTDAKVREAIVNFILAHPLGEPEAVQGKLYETENVRLIRK